MSWNILKSSRFDINPLAFVLSIDNVTLSRPSRDIALFVCADSYMCVAKLILESILIGKKRKDKKSEG